MKKTLSKDKLQSGGSAIAPGWVYTPEYLATRAADSTWADQQLRSGNTTLVDNRPVNGVAAPTSVADPAVLARFDAFDAAKKNYNKNKSKDLIAQYYPNGFNPELPTPALGFSIQPNEHRQDGGVVRKIRIKSLPTAQFGGQKGFGLNLNTYGFKSQDLANPNKDTNDFAVNNTLKEVPEQYANVEAEKGETALGDFDNDGQLEHMRIGGDRHVDGGTPLNVPSGTFIFSDTKKMRIKDKEVLAMFGKSQPTTPADIAKQYDLNKYKAILADPGSDNYAKKTAEMMLKNNTDKLKNLAMIQESMKGFPQGMPNVAGGQTARFGGRVKAQDGLQFFSKTKDPVTVQPYFGVSDDDPDSITELPSGNYQSGSSYNSSNTGVVPQPPTPAYMQGTSPEAMTRLYNNIDAARASAGSMQPQPIQFDNRSKVPFKYMTPDVNNILGADLDMANTHKYLPWSSPFRATTPETVYYDPGRELAANQEAANSQTYAAAMSGNGSMGRAMASSIQGQALSNVANILGKYNNMNVGQADKASATAADIANNQGMYESKRKTEDYRGNVIADQQYDNAMKMGRDRMVYAQNQAWNNRMMMNKVNENGQYFYTDPTTGRTVQKEGLNLNSLGSGSPTQSGGDINDQMLKDIDGLSKKYPNVNSSTLYQIVKNKYGMGSISTTNPYTGVRTRGMGSIYNQGLYPGANPYQGNSAYGFGAGAGMYNDPANYDDNVMW